jgi:acetyl-CoA carboxylase carboxyltransferase component
MGPAGVEFVYKDELRNIRGSVKAKTAKAVEDYTASGLAEDDAIAAANQAVTEWVKSEETLLAQRYERELMNPNEALSLGSISQIVMPSDLRQVITKNMSFHLRHYHPGPLQNVQREFH